MRALTSKALLHIGPGWRSSQTTRARTTCTAGGGNVELIGTWSISPRKSHGPPPSIESLSRPANAPSSCFSGRHLLGSARVHGLALLCGWAGYPRNLTSTGEGRRETDRGGQQKRPRWIAMAELRCTPSLLGPVHFVGRSWRRLAVCLLRQLEKRLPSHPRNFFLEKAPTTPKRNRQTNPTHHNLYTPVLVLGFLSKISVYCLAD